MAEEVEVIPEWKIKHAWAQCMKDPKLNLYFSNAPYGAKQYVALAFYCKVFADEVTEDKYKIYVGEVEAEMSAEDMKYVARNDFDAGARRYFAARLAERFPESAAALIAEQMEAAKNPPKPTPHVEFPGFENPPAPASAERKSNRSLPTWILAALSFVLLLALAWAIVTRRAPARGDESAPAEETAPSVVPVQTATPETKASAPEQKTADATTSSRAAEEERRDMAARALIQERQALEDVRSALNEEKRKLVEEWLTLSNRVVAFEAERKDFEAFKKKAMEDIAAEAAKIAEAAQKQVGAK